MRRGLPAAPPSPAPTSGPGARRGLYVALLLCVGSGVLLLTAGSGTWSTLTVPGVSPLPDRDVAVHGRDLVPGLRAVGVVALAGVPALLAVRRAGRVLVGLLLLAAGLLVAVLVVRVLVDAGGALLDVDLPDDVAPPGEGTYDTYLAGSPDLGARPYGALLGALLLLLAGLLTTVRGRTWPALGQRYEAPSARPVTVEQPTDKGTWDALDRGEDPTADPRP